jgi:hypothetical protein
MTAEIMKIVEMTIPFGFPRFHEVGKEN